MALRYTDRCMNAIALSDRLATSVWDEGEPDLPLILGGSRKENHRNIRQESLGHGLRVASHPGGKTIING